MDKDLKTSRQVMLPAMVGKEISKHSPPKAMSVDASDRLARN